ncbi:hypothetical protein Droror1_Dr00018526 [Drosera rotundifolia]
MSKSSRSQVTITLGRSGRVVKRGGSAADDQFDDDFPATGSKRSIRDRLGRNGDRFIHNKRQQVKDNDARSNDIRLGRGDLRFKLMQKNMNKRPRNDSPDSDIDLRNRLPSRKIRSRKASYAPEVKANHAPSVASVRTRESVPDHRDVDFLGRVPSSRSEHHLPAMDPYRTPHSSWTMDSLRQRTPDRLMQRPTYGALSPPRSVQELPRRSLIRDFDDGKPYPFVRNKVRSPPRPVGSNPFLPKPTQPATAAKPVAPLVSQLTAPSGSVSRVPYSGGEHATVGSLLSALGLEKYVIAFKHEEVDMHALRQMSDNDLKELGIPMGPRKKILQALARQKRIL